MELRNHIPGFRLIISLCAAAALFAACSTGGSSDGGERIYGTPVDPEVFFPPANESSGTQNEAREVEIAKCLTSKGAVLYGASWCQWTQKQISSFGDGFRNITYVECTQQEQLCDGKGIDGYPTWILGERRYGGYYPPATLAGFAGCD